MAPTTIDWRRWLAARGEDLPLDEALYWVSVDEGATTALAEVEAQLDELAEGLPRDPDIERSLSALVQRLFVERGIRGDTDDYDNPENSRIDRVLARGKGLPILLSAVTIEVARRASIPLVGVSFPGHFLVSTPSEPRIFFDPFRGGRRQSVAELAARLERDAPVTSEILARSLAPCTARDLVLRVSTNLMGSWLRRNDLARALRSAERRVVLRPEVPEMLRDRGWLLAKLGRVDRAAFDLASYLEARPDAPDTPRVERLLSSLPLASS